MVAHTRSARTARSARRLNAPRPALVESHADGTPRRVNRQDVAVVREEWRVVDRWWTEEPVAPPLLRPRARDRARTPSSTTTPTTGAWFTQRAVTPNLVRRRRTRFASVELPCRTSSCTRTPPTRSSTARRCRGARRARRRARLRRARAHRPRRRLRLARVRPRREASRRAADHRRRGDARRTALTSRCSARRGRATRTSAASSPTRTRARASRGRSATCCRPGRRSAFVERHAEGLVCLSGCARNGLAVVDANAAERLARAFPGAFYVELQRPYERGDASRNARLAELAEHLGVPTVATGDVHAHSPARARLQDALVAIKHRTSLDGCERERRGNHEAVLLAPQAMLERLPADAAAPHARARRPLRVRPDAGARLPLSRLLRRSRPRRSAAREDLRATLRRALRDPLAEPFARVRANGCDEELALIARLGLSGFFLLHWEVLELARECALEVRGPGSPAPCAAAGARPRLQRRLDRLLPDRPLARRSRRSRPVARPLPQRRDGRRARHRPRLPARHPREADRARHRALRPRARRARRDLRDLSQPRRDPRRRQGARAAVRRAGAARTRHRRLGRDPRRRRARRCARHACRARAGPRSAS